MIREKLSAALMTVLVAAAIAFCALTAPAAAPADACFFQPQPAPAPGMTSGTDCAWRFPDGKTFDQEFAFASRLDEPLYILLPLVLSIPLSIMMPGSAWMDLGKAARRRLRYITPGSPPDSDSP
jgi:hypothetical protein